nr:hypothetical protein [Nitrosomonas nitrosa]
MGWLAEKPGSVILREKMHEIQENRYTLIIFALATQADQNIVGAIQRQWRDIDKLTGRRILFIAFYNARPMDYEVYSRSYYSSGYIAPSLKHLLGMQPDTIDTERFMSSMTEESYELARSLGIPLTNLPCFAFFETHNAEAFQVLNLKDLGESELLQTLRRFASEYYNSSRNRDYFQSVERLEELEQKRTNLIRRLRQIPEDLTRTNLRIEQLQTQLPLEEKRTTDSIRKSLLKDIRLSERDRLAKEVGLTKVISKIGTLRRVLSTLDDVAKNIILGWVLNAEIDLLRSITSDPFLPQIEQFVEDLDNGQLQESYRQLSVQIKAGDISQKNQVELFNQREVIRVKKEQVRSAFLQLLDQEAVIDMQKAKDKLHSLEHQQQLLASSLRKQINEIASSRMEAEIESALLKLRDSTTRELTRLRETVQRLSTKDEENAVKQEMELVIKEIQVLRQKVNSSYPDGFGILEAVSRGANLRRVASSAGKQFRDYAPSIIDLISLILK